MKRDEELLELLEILEKRMSENKLMNLYFQPNTPLSIEHYPKHKLFFDKGAEVKQRLFMAGNRIGKTETAALYETVCHAINWYPPWWKGHRFPSKKNLTFWVAGNTRATCREILQVKLLGKTKDSWGTGLIPKDNIGRITLTPGMIDTVNQITVNRIGGGTTMIFLKSYEMGRTAFEGTEVDLVVLDEEPPHDVYVECLLRTMTTKGKLIMPFTPLKGFTQLIQEFTTGTDEYGNPDPTKATIQATWDDAPHLSKEDRAAMWASIPEYQRDARTKGIPLLGMGAVYKVSLDDILVEDFEIPKHWKKTFGLDVGYNNTACVWIAVNPDTGMHYVYSEMHKQQSQPHEYAREILQRGDWIDGVIDPAANNSTQVDGTKIMELLIKEGLKLQKADNSVESGIYKVWELLSTNMLKVFKGCTAVQKEYRTYQRDEKGKVVKKDDHFMDALRYGVVSGVPIAKSLSDIEKAKARKNNQNTYNQFQGKNGWMG